MIVESAVDRLAGKNKRIDSGLGAVIGDPGLVQVPRLLAAKLKPVQDAHSRLLTLEQALEPREGALAELRKRRAMVRRRKHDEVLHRASSQLRVVVKLHPQPNDGTPCGMRDASEPVFHLVAERVIERLLERTRDIVERDRIDEADVLAQVHVLDLV